MKQHVSNVNATAYLDEIGQTRVSSSDESIIKVCLYSPSGFFFYVVAL